MKRLTLLLITLLCLSSVHALGITPAKVTVSPEKQGFTLTPLDIGDGVLSARVEGPYATSIELELADKITGRFIPNENIPPGEHGHKVILTVTPDETAGTVGGIVEVASLVRMIVPRGDAFLQADWTLNYDENAQHVLTTIMLENLGEQQVTPANVTVTIGRDTITINPQVVEPLAYAKLTGIIGEQEPGEYTTTLEVLYNERTLREEKNVAIGQPSISIEDIQYVDEAGLIKPIDVTGRLYWNRALDGTITLDTTPRVTEPVTIDGQFTQRVYLDTSETGEPENITVTVTVGGVTATKTVQTADIIIAAPRSWIIPALIVLIALLMGLIMWKSRNVYKH
ncbi:MAG: hypothetical protein OXR66_00990 [Candidatus Woesearchaeota archaeon]|nr:hypothetical protein [Candidatus Woesearchaeota archaeon]